ncbi:hypothetical protein BCR42DRAFT_450178 [Absidia repens]|uniref:RING-type E3 ubiquitin transferase n=1 Tax=Absidia repens TaxID=90262 RepID=A0A1X2IMQ9_9FUNG|nr:hypothetical protein BCR42DRAFT_450178 [Absidia repens]
MDPEAICRVCRCEGSTEQPLFHPCKCSGSIRYVHQDCLMEWLAHSRKKYCELCEHPYSFSSVYRGDMPDTIPVSLFLLQLGKKLAKLIYVVLRACLVACAWLFILPYFTITVWRFYFWSGDLLSGQLRRLQSYSAANQLYASTLFNNINNVTNTNNVASATVTIASAIAANTMEAVMETGLPSNQSTNATSNDASQFVVFGQSFSTSGIKTVLADCFEGQVVTFFVFVVFISIFHLRTWIVQNIPEEMLEDTEDAALPDDDHQDDLIDQDQGDPHELRQPEPLNALFGQNNLAEDNEPLRDNIQVRWEDDDDIGNNHGVDELQDMNHGLRGHSPTANIYHDFYEQQDLYHNRIDALRNSDNNTRNNRRAVSEPPNSRQLLDDDGDSLTEMSSEFSYWRQRATSAEPSLQYYHSSSAYMGDNHSLPEQYSRGSIRDHPIKLEEDYFDDHLLAAEASSSSGVPLQQQRNDIHHTFDDQLRYEQRQQQQHEQQQHQEEEPNRQQNLPHLDIPAQQPEPLRQEPPAPFPQAEVPPFVNDDDEIGGDEILDILNAAGMRGSIWTLVQNISLIGLVISTSLALTVWMPFLIGMTFVMADIFDVIRVPLLIARMVTDPIIEWLISFSVDIIWPATTKGLDSLYRWHPTITYLLQTSVSSSPASTTIINNGTVGSSTGLSFGALETAYSTLLHWINRVEPTLKAMGAWYQHLAVGTSVSDRVMCILIGYAVALVMSSNPASHVLARMMFGDSAQRTVRQQYLILKTGMFLTIELFVFPIACGILLDLSTMSAMNLPSAWDRFEYILSNPVSSMFVYWFVGTMFMLMFAWLITNCRSILRPGVMWFIRDPNDPQFHPIREIIQRPVWNQLQKIGTSAAMYSLIILIGVGGVVQIIHYFGQEFSLLQWNLTRSRFVVLSDPIIVILVRIVVPTLIRYFQPTRAIKKVWIQWLQFLCRQLRLTSFMFGVRTMDEEGVMRYPTWSGWILGTLLRQHNRGQNGVLEWNGQLVRAPKHDSVQYIPGRRMLIPVDPVTLLPLNEREQQLGHPASRGDGGEEANTVIVYTPPQFRLRVALFMAMLWLSGSVLLCSITILPLVVGRCIFKQGLHIEVPMHDMYSYLVGSITMLMIGASIGYLASVAGDVVSHTNTTGRLGAIVNHVKNLTRMGIKWIFFIVTFGIVVPVLLGSTIEVYFFIPQKELGDNLPSFDPLAIWVRGIACMNVMRALLLILPTNTFQTNLTQAFRRGITNVNLRFLCAKILMPFCVFCLAALLLPLLSAYAMVQLFVSDDLSNKIKVAQLMYPASMLALVSYYAVRLGIRLGHHWVQSVREDHYLIGRTLHNMDE